ncbi:hypothetical protein CP965_09275 [Halarcobacter mediterraneus]|uniref:Uncharacterized protein n=1 Tax=Halarcobacter mediterraneus TaxID=2023153 RepID=A0A4V1M197_9BACT|nr:hypothetical protein [Halarcobacter mediterraneus]RXK12755.1 hypothetical protein CP965_09275 [Halarcobacter mediterraneus]
MRKKSFLSYEAKVIIAIIAVIVFIFLPFSFYDNFIEIKNNLVLFYDEKFSEIPIWIQVLPIILIIILIVSVKLIRKNRSKYTEDVFYNIKWKWKWNKDNISDLECFCPTCGETLYYDDTTSKFTLKVSKIDFICDNCQKVMGSIPNENNKLKSSQLVNKEIQRLIFKKLSKNQNLTN